MSNDIQPVLNKAPHAPREGVFIPRKQVQKMRRARDIVDEARRCARGIVKEAQQQAAAARRQAHAAGYRDGALAAASHVLAHFAAVQALARRMRDELEQHARTLLGAALDHPDTVLALLDQCLQALAGPQRQRIMISLPSAMRGSRARLQALLEHAGHGAAEIEYRDDARMAVLAGEQVFEFDACEALESGQSILLAQFPDLADAGRGLGQEAMQRWHDAFAQRFAAAGGGQVASAETTIADEAEAVGPDDEFSCDDGDEGEDADDEREYAQLIDSDDADWERDDDEDNDDEDGEDDDGDDDGDEDDGDERDFLSPPRGSAGSVRSGD